MAGGGARKYLRRNDTRTCTLFPAQVYRSTNSTPPCVIKMDLEQHGSGGYPLLIAEDKTNLFVNDGSYGASFSCGDPTSRHSGTCTSIDSYENLGILGEGGWSSMISCTIHAFYSHHPSIRHCFPSPRQDPWKNRGFEAIPLCL